MSTVMDECLLCLENDSSFYILECKHFFCTMCREVISKQLKKKKQIKCPICKSISDSSICNMNSTEITVKAKTRIIFSKQTNINLLKDGKTFILEIN